VGVSAEYLHDEELLITIPSLVTSGSLHLRRIAQTFEQLMTLVRAKCVRLQRTPLPELSPNLACDSGDLVHIKSLLGRYLKLLRRSFVDRRISIPGRFRFFYGK